MSLNDSISIHRGKSGIFTPDFIVFAAVSLVFWIFMLYAVGHSITHHSHYDEHTLQALAWQNGSVSLADFRDGKWRSKIRAFDYLNGNTDPENEITYHEVAKYKNKVYISFPPTPTFIEFPFALIFGRETPNTFVLLVFTWAAMLLSFFILLKLTGNRYLSYFVSFSFFWGSTICYLSLSGAVWHQGQLYGLFFAVLSVFILLYSERPAMLPAGGFCLALAVGCRPFYLIMTVFYLYHAYKRFPKISSLLFVIAGLIPPGLFYAVYNYIRFDSILEIGHSYLPWESTLEHGVISLHYFPTNIYHALIQPPEWDAAKNILSFHGAGTGLWFSSPVILLGFAFFLKKAVLSLKKAASGKKADTQGAVETDGSGVVAVHENRDGMTEGAGITGENGAPEDDNIPADNPSGEKKDGPVTRFLRGLSFREEDNIPACEVVCSALAVFGIWFCLLLHASNGWYQFGYRFSVDLIPLLLFFFGRTFRKNHLFLLPVCLFSIAVNIYGAFWFYILGQ
ncbi:MAG: hypothetical protein JW881_07205 [Spirochaetales bacterium]|nr:hypothetical protein [Spirochaetales bacterium]